MHKYCKMLLPEESALTGGTCIRHWIEVRDIFKAGFSQSKGKLFVTKFTGLCKGFRKT